jgi:uncharacterized membrane protein
VSDPAASSRHPHRGRGPVARNIQAIMRIEEEEHRRRSRLDRFADVVSRFAGSAWFPVVHVVWFSVWIGMNVSGRTHFDPYPFTFLTFLVSLEAIFLSGFILVSQTHSERLAEQRAHLDLQINLLSEEEMTKVLQALSAIARHLNVPGVVDDPDTQQLATSTDVEEVAKAVHDASTSSAQSRGRD